MVKSSIKNNLSVFIPIGNTSEKIQQISSPHYSPLLVICKIVFFLVRTEISKHFLSSTNFVNKKNNSSVFLVISFITKRRDHLAH